MTEINQKIRIIKPRTSKVLNKGKSRHRLADNPEEKAFAEAWDAINRGPLETGVRTLDYLLIADGVTAREPTAEERELAATVVQWLGSTCGQFFLGELGYQKVVKQNKEGAHAATGKSSHR
jgi:hypothetical protein